MNRRHTHPCDSCGQPVECDGARERNYDGVPAVICTTYHLPGGTLGPVVCGGCDEETDASEQQAIRTDDAQG